MVHSKYIKNEYFLILCLNVKNWAIGLKDYSDHLVKIIKTFFFILHIIRQSNVEQIWVPWGTPINQKHISKHKNIHIRQNWDWNNIYTFIPSWKSSLTCIIEDRNTSRIYNKSDATEMIWNRKSVQRSFLLSFFFFHI